MKSLHLKNVNKTDSGRSMVEILGVLAIVGVLTAMGIAGFSSAMKKSIANELLYRASMSAVSISNNLLMNNGAITTDFEDASDYALTATRLGTRQFQISITGKAGHAISAKICNLVKSIKGSDVIAFAPDPCTDNATLVLTYNNNLSDKVPTNFCDGPACMNGLCMGTMTSGSCVRDCGYYQTWVNGVGCANLNGSGECYGPGCIGGYCKGGFVSGGECVTGCYGEANRHWVDGVGCVCCEGQVVDGQCVPSALTPSVPNCQGSGCSGNECHGIMTSGTCQRCESYGSYGWNNYSNCCAELGSGPCYGESNSGNNSNNGYGCYGSGCFNGECLGVMDGGTCRSCESYGSYIWNGHCCIDYGSTACYTDNNCLGSGCFDGECHGYMEGGWCYSCNDYLGTGEYQWNGNCCAEYGSGACYGESNNSCYGSGCAYGVCHGYMDGGWCHSCTEYPGYEWNGNCCAEYGSGACYGESNNSCWGSGCVGNECHGYSVSGGCYSCSELPGSYSWNSYSNCCAEYGSGACYGESDSGNNSGNNCLGSGCHNNECLGYSESGWCFDCGVLPGNYYYWNYNRHCCYGSGACYGESNNSCYGAGCVGNECHGYSVSGGCYSCDMLPGSYSWNSYSNCCAEYGSGACYGESDSGNNSDNSCYGSGCEGGVCHGYMDGGWCTNCNELQGNTSYEWNGNCCAEYGSGACYGESNNCLGSGCAYGECRGYLESGWCHSCTEYPGYEWNGNCCAEYGSGACFGQN